MVRTDGFDRRGFLSRTAVGLGALALGWPRVGRAQASGAGAQAGADKPNPSPAAPVAPSPAATELIPTRPFGRTGVSVSCLSLGTMFDTMSNQIVLRRAVDLGVRHWDTADCYEGGDSEKGIGRFLGRFPADRDKVFLVTKSDDRDPDDMRKLLDRSLERLKTDRIDLYLLHGMTDADELTPAVRRFAEEEKRKGRIRLFGFSTHRNMAELLQAAAKAGFVDGVLTSYNHELRKDPKMDAAVQAAHDAGIGLAAMKILRGAAVDRDDPLDRKYVVPHLDAGFSDEQARLLAVLSDPRIATACLTMKNIQLLETYVAAALGRPKLRAGG